MLFGFACWRRGASLAALAIFTFAPSTNAAEPAPFASVRLFGSSENTNSDISPFPKWTDMLARYQREQPLEDAPCAGGRCPLQAWKAFVMTLQGQDRLRQLEAVNAYTNRIPYRSDLDRYGTVDHWATPRESLGRSADCEDYAIIKYLSLRKLGWSASELRLLVLQHETRKELHAVLIAYHNGTAYVLDNLIPDVREHAAIRDYRPIFSINEIAWHYHRDWNPHSAVLVAKAEPMRTPRSHAGAIAGSTVPQLASTVPLAIDTVRPAYQPPLVRLAARSFAANPDESLAVLFSNAGNFR